MNFFYSWRKGKNLRKIIIRKAIYRNLIRTMKIKAGRQKFKKNYDSKSYI